MVDQQGETPKKRLRWWQWALIVLVGFFVLLALVPTPPPPNTSKQPALSSVSAADMVADIEPSTVEPSAAASPPPIFTTTAREVRAAFDDNEIAARKRYKDLPMRVSGTVAGVQSDIFGSPQVLLSAGEYRTAVMSLAAGDEAAAAELHTGDKVTAECGGADTTLTILSFSDCRL